MEEIIKCKVLEIRESIKYNCSYHIILKNLKTNERFSLIVDEIGTVYFNNVSFDNVINKDILIKGDIVNMKLDKEFYNIEFEILEEESEV